MPRRPTGQAKEFVIPLRLTGEQRDAIREAAALEHLDVSAWLRKTALDAAGAVKERATAPEIARLSPLLRTTKPADWGLPDIVELVMIRDRLPAGLQRLADKVIQFHRPSPRR